MASSYEAHAHTFWYPGSLFSTMFVLTHLTLNVTITSFPSPIYDPDIQFSHLI